jgi:hypothetical protein
LGSRRASALKTTAAAFSPRFWPARSTVLPRSSEKSVWPANALKASISIWARARSMSAMMGYGMRGAPPGSTASASPAIPTKLSCRDRPGVTVYHAFQSRPTSSISRISVRRRSQRW